MSRPGFFRNIMSVVIVVVIAVTAIIVSGYWAASTRSLPLGLNTDRLFYGNITSGEKFGFRVGQPFHRDQVQEIHRHLTYYGVSKCAGTYKTVSGCIGARLHASFQTERLFYHGQVFVEIGKDNRISAIVWNADVVPLEWQS